MDKKRVKIKSQMPLWQFILIVLVLFALVFGVCYLLFNEENLSGHTRYRSWELIGLIFFAVPFLFSEVMSKKEYLSDIYIDDKEILLVYKIRNKITRTQIIEKNNIKSLEFNADINVIGAGRNSRTEVSYGFFVDLIKGQDFETSDISSIALAESNYKFIFNILDAAKYIPNFKFNLNSNSELIKAEIDYYRRFGRKIPFKTKTKMHFKKCSLFEKILLIICLACLLFALGIGVFTYKPVSLNKTEKQYLELIKDSYNYRKITIKRLKNLMRREI